MSSGPSLAAHRPFVRHPLAHAVVLACLACAALPAAHAQTTAPAAAVQVDIPAGTLDQVLNRFAARAGFMITIDATLTAGKTSPGLAGRYGVGDGLAAILSGSGLQAVGQAGGGWLLRAAAPQAPAVVQADSAGLPAITAVANQLGEVTEGSGHYTPGAIATATRLVLTPRETPQTVSVVTRQEMDDFGLTTIDEVMAHTPGVSIVTYDTERTEYFSRGFAIQNFQYDGIPMRRDSSYSAGNTLSDMAIYDRVEVLKGATGLLTGSGEPGATINLIRKKPTREFQGQASLGVGSWSDVRGQVDVGGAVDEAGRVRARGVAAYQQKESQLDGHERKTAVLYGVVEADLTPSTLLTVGADYQNNDPKRSTWGGIPIFAADGSFNDQSRSFNNGADWSHWDQYTRTVFATVEHYFDNDWVLKAQFNHQINGYDAELGSAASGFPDPVNGSGVSTWEGKYVGKTVADAVDVYASGPFQLLGRRHELVAGGSITKRRWTNRGYWAGSTEIADYGAWNGQLPEPDWDALTPSRNRETTRENGLYGAVRWNLRDDLKLISGARVLNYDGPDIDESGVFTPYLGLVYDVDKRVSVYASGTTIFMPQSAQTEAGKTLDPQEGRNLEAGVKAEFFGGRLNASAAVFHLKQDNYAEETGGLTPGGGTAYRAIDGVSTKGFELELSGQVAPNWQLHAGYSHKVSRQDGEKVSTLTPENQFSLFSSWQPAAVPGLKLGGGARWQDKTWGTVSHPTLGSVRHDVDGYWVVDAMASYRVTPRLTARLNVTNLFDKKYYTIFSWYSTYSWGEARAVALNLDYRF
ncbi:TonB-dependent siderophore receptor [Rubrivivax gelatinosus]|uniref:TonB-dependent siderophore receptor n=1 Tax=Rubrivivax gelatinosus TaxID=28068 RepID=A0ABS1DXU1_RUBGE|nr:TonB-dependent receptor [Rubrivivax gelatinosus]MBK1714906.1 TonB-dependent siderophore receptor [Rubrivivax gelatinosus]